MNKAAQFILVVVLLGAGLLGAGLLRSGHEPTPPLPPEAHAPLVETRAVQVSDEALFVTSQGTVRPRNEGLLASEVSGQVEWLSPDLVAGGFFEKGEVLLRLDPKDLRLAVVAAEAGVAEANLRLELERADAEVARKEWAELADAEASPLALRLPQLANAEARLAAARAELDRSERDLARTSLRAPYAGRVRDESVDLGQFVTRGQALARIHAVDLVEVRLPLPNHELAFLDVPLSYRGDASSGDLPRVLLSAQFAGKQHGWEALLVRTEGELDPRSRMVQAVVEVADPYGRGEDPDRPPLAVGMFVEARIVGRVAKDVARLPRSALRGDDEVLVLRERDEATATLSLRGVEVLRTEGDEVLISAGLQQGELVCLTPLDSVTNGMLVRTSAAVPQLGSSTASGSELGTDS